MEGHYEVEAENRHGVATARFAIQSAGLRILLEPESVTTWLGSQVQFEVQALGENLTYQWRHNNVALAGATNSRLSLTNVSWPMAGEYKVTIRNATGELTSREVRLELSSIGSAGFPFGSHQRAPVGASNLVSLGYLSATRRDGAMIRWGASPGPIYSYETVAPQTNPLLRGILSTNVGGLGLTVDGRVIAIAPTPLSSNIPPGLSNVVELDSSFNAALAILGDGRVASWRSQPSAVLPRQGLSNVVGGAIGSYGGGVWTIDHRLHRFQSQIIPVSVGEHFDFEIPGILDGAAGWGNLTLLSLEGLLSSLFSSSVIAERVTDVASVDYYTAVYYLVGEGAPHFLPVRTKRSGSVGIPMFLKGRATGAMPISYRWRMDGQDLPGETNLVLSVPTAQARHAQYEVVASNSEGASTLVFDVHISDEQPVVLYIQKAAQGITLLLPETHSGNPTLLESHDLAGWTAASGGPAERVNGFHAFTVSTASEARFFRVVH
jgi:hypothetical protein